MTTRIEDALMGVDPIVGSRPRMTSRFHPPFAGAFVRRSLMDSNPRPSALPAARSAPRALGEARDADNGFNSVRMDRRAKKNVRWGRIHRGRWIDGLPGTMVNFGSNRLILEFQPAPAVPLC